MNEFPTRYDPAHESEQYTRWESSGAFQPTAHSRTGDHFSIVLPPPNVTGTLHVGHAVMLALEDMMVRYHRMKGDRTLWIPGLDHAAIATQNVVEKKLKKENVHGRRTRHELGREAFLAEVEKFVEQSKTRIIEQTKAMGASLDWSRLAYTLDEQRSRAVREMFVRMYDAGILYRGNRIVNWCPRCKSTLADDEVNYKEEQTPFYYLKYGPVIIGTARPETKFQDKTLVVHPEDERYTHLVGTTFAVPWIEDAPLTSNVIADSIIDRAFGTGAMTITPAHSFEDFALAQTHGLPIVTIIDEGGNLTDAAGSFAGRNAREARVEIVEQLRAKGLVDRVDEHYVHNLSVCYRCETPIEPLPKLQWFVAVSKPFRDGKSLKDLALDAVRSGAIRILPERFTGEYFHWMQNLRDWCISRQIWFGHRLPVWYRGDEVYVGRDTPSGAGWEQDPDTLDTWFSTGMWTFSTLGWPIVNDVGFDEQLVELVKNGSKTKTYRLTDKGFTIGETVRTHNSQTKEQFGYLKIVSVTPTTLGAIDWLEDGHEQYPSQEELFATMRRYYPSFIVRSDSPVWVYSFQFQEQTDLEHFHPTSVLETGYDILFFWIARMILMTEFALGEVPFRTVYLHGLVRDAQGRKMSKSLGNVIDPLDMVQQYGADAVRLALFIGTAPGQDTKLDEQKIAGYAKFITKIWNIARYVSMTIGEEHMTGDFASIPDAELTHADRWILARLRVIVTETTDAYERFEFSRAAQGVYDFAWHEFADWYVEATKITHAPHQTIILREVLMTILRLLHPAMPFVTEALWDRLDGEGILITRAWPTPESLPPEDFLTRAFAFFQEIIIGIRKARSDMAIPPKTEIDVVFRPADDEGLRWLHERELLELAKRFARVRGWSIQSTVSGTPTATIRNTAVYVVPSSPS